MAVNPQICTESRSSLLAEGSGEPSFNIDSIQRDSAPLPHLLLENVVQGSGAEMLWAAAGSQQD